MAELEADLDRSDDKLEAILALLASAGYPSARIPDLSPADMLTGGLAWCVTCVAATHGDDFSIRDKIKAGEVIVAALCSMECPYALQAHQIQELNYKSIYPVVKWIVGRVLTTQGNLVDKEKKGAKEEEKGEEKIEEGSGCIQKLEKELVDAENSIKMLQASLKEQELKKADVNREIEHLNEKVNAKDVNDVVKRLVSLLQLLKSLERKESDFITNHKQKSLDMQTEVLELEQKSLESSKSETNSIDLEHFLCDSMEMLNSAKRALAAKLRANLSLKRRLDDVPSQLELIQYELRFSELYGQIQETHRQTREYYATYNALMEVKELMLKETSLLNSISAQFQDAMTSTIGRTKLIDSLESIAKGTQQKLKKVQLGLQAEQKICDSLKEKYVAAITEQRQRSTFLKAFQEECARNERLRSLTSV